MNAAFQVHILNEQGVKKSQEIADRFDSFFSDILALSTFDGRNYGRNIEVVRTKLEEASFFTKKAMAELPENQKSVD
jgi:hypothetical protein